MDTISVIIPTTCSSQRKELLSRAISSVLEQQGVNVKPILVVNGRKFDSEYFESLKSDARLTVAYLETPGLPFACQHGRSLVTSPYFCFLDDDDEYLPDALATRLRLLNEDPSLALVTTNGYVGTDNRPAYRETAGINSDPLMTLAEGNWLASCGGLYRSSSIDEQFFVNLSPYIEWTTLAFRILLAGKRVKFCNVPTFRINDTQDSLSKSEQYRTSMVAALEGLLRLKLPSGARQRLRSRLLAARHELSVYNLQRGNKIAALKLHLRSMTGLSGLKYLSYTRHLFS